MGQFKGTSVIVTNKNNSESEMAPNAEEELLAVKPWGPQPEKQERLRPPTYNAEDYAVALRRWGRRPIASPPEPQTGTLPSTTSSSSGYVSGGGEMTLRQFTSVSELLNKLRADLRLAFPSFVQEFASSPADGITLLLETLRGVQLAQNSPPSSGQIGPRIGTRRAALDELGCVECLAACGERCADAPRLLIEAQPGLLALAVCLTSSLNRSRVLALQLLTRVCQAPGGHAAVSEAVSTLRLRYGEGGRFRFLAGALLAPRAAMVLRVAGVSFLNAFIGSATRAQTKLYIQAEACEAGLEPKILQEWLTELDSNVEESLTELLRKEVHRWARNCVDVEALQKRASRAEETCRRLGKKILALQNQIENLQVRNMNGYNSSRDSCEKKLNGRKKLPSNKISSNADDEGISSSERSSTPDEFKRDLSGVDNDRETTIDDVIEELRIIVKDAEEEYEDKKTGKICKNVTPQQSFVGKNSDDKNSSNSLANPNAKPSLKYSQSSRTATNSCSESFLQRCEQNPVTYFGNCGGNTDPEDFNCSDSLATRKLSSNHSSISKSSADGSLKILVKGPDIEEAIVPAIIHPQPPKRSPPCLTAILAARNCAFVDTEEAYNSPGEELEEETLGDGSDSLLSASRLKYAQNEPTTVFRTQGEGKLANSCENLTEFKRNLQERRGSEKFEKKTIRNYDSGMILNGIDGTKTERDSRIYENNVSTTRKNGCNSHKAYSQSSGQSLKYGFNSRRSSDVEKRKILRRTSSQDCLDPKSRHGKLKRSESGIEGRIRKFESLNSFENMSLNSFSRSGSVENVNGLKLQQFEDNAKGRTALMRRSESFHHVSVAASGKRETSSRGGSDSGLFYVTNFDLEPVISVTQQLKPDNTKSPNLLTKSLDRIDEGLDSMVDIVLTEDKQWMEEESRLRMTKNGNDQKRLKNGNNKLKSDKRNKNDSQQLKSDEFYNSFCQSGTTKQLRSDELYNEKPLVQKHWNYETELNNARKLTSSHLSGDNALGVLTKPGSVRESFCLEKSVGSKFSEGSNESGIYLPSRSYDVFGLSKSRFNAGKYSENNLPSTRDNLNNSHPSKNSIILPASNNNNHGKVTDVLSGLY